MEIYKPISSKCNFLLHGADYNPEQWKDTPEIWDEDIRLMKLAGCNVMSVGIFSWSHLEPEEGQFEFGWLDNIMDKLSSHNIYTILATPSGARPAWLSEKYPEVLRVQENRVRNLHGRRHNHCLTSPLYREKVNIINSKLAERYKDHPGLIMWHVSNEYGGECHCDLCQEAFREWLKKKYEGNLDNLNKAWWTTFWSHTYSKWSQIESPAPHGENFLHGLNLDWKRFVTDQTIDFFKSEIEPLRKFATDIPVTTNFDNYVNIFKGCINYWKFAPYVDVVSWDNYPYWHGERSNWVEASRRGFIHDINRALKGGKPFMMMESSPSATNWQPVGKLRRPGMHVLASIQAIAHGSDTVQYFQWRKSRGSSEKFHGAVVDHCGHENNRVFNEVAQVGKVLDKLQPVTGAVTNPQAAVIYDWENSWAIDDAQGPRKEKKNYFETCHAHYHQLWKRGIATDVIDMDTDFSQYKLLIAPMLYMVREGVAEKMKNFVENGGCLVLTYWSGITDENDLCFLGGFPGPLRDLAGIWAEEIDGLYENDENYVIINKNNGLGLLGEYVVKDLCEIIHAEGAEILATYKDDFYAGMPALTAKAYGKGKTYYIAFRNNDDFLDEFYQQLVNDLNLKKALYGTIPEGVTVQKRSSCNVDFIFIQNYSSENKEIDLGDETYFDIIAENETRGIMEISGYGLKILSIKHKN